MHEVTESRSDSSLDWLYAESAQYPLLSAEQEQSFDREKWSAARSLQEAMLDVPEGARFISLWASNLTTNPPSLSTLPDKELYQLLKRDQSKYLKPGAFDAQLAILSAGKGNDRDIQCALEALELDATLVIGMAECLLGKRDGRDVAAALQRWQTLWPERTRELDPFSRPAFQRLVDNYYRARNGLINHNLRLVFSIAGKSSGQLPYRDLIQEGTLGLIRAAEKYRYDKGYRFSTYAFNWINQAVRRAKETQGGAVRFPAHVRALVSSIHRERINYQNRFGQEPEREVLAGLVDIEPGKLDQYEQLGDLALSLDSNASHDPEAPSLLEKLAGGPFEEPESSTNRAWLLKVLKSRLALLSIDEKRVITRRWGLDGSAPGSRKEVARSMNVSTEWVRQLESLGLEKLSGDRTLQQVFQDQYQNSN